MEHLSVEVRDRNIVVTQPLSGQSVTYWKESYAPMLEAVDPWRQGFDAERLAFLASAWKAAYHKAREIGWL